METVPYCIVAVVSKDRRITSSWLLHQSCAEAELFASTCRNPTSCVFGGVFETFTGYAHSLETTLELTILGGSSSLSIATFVFILTK